MQRQYIDLTWHFAKAVRVYRIINKQKKPFEIHTKWSLSLRKLDLKRRMCRITLSKEFTNILIKN